MTEREVPVHLFKHCGFWLDIGWVDDFKTAQEIDWQGESTSLEAVAIWQALGIDRERLVHFGGVSNLC